METNGKALHVRYGELDEKKRQLEVDLAQVKEEMAGMQEALIEKFITDDIMRISLKGGLTLKLDRKVWPKLREGKTSEDLIAAIKAANLPELLAKESYQSSVLGAYLREHLDQDLPLPDELDAVIVPNPVYKIKTIKQ